jgi:hypothetical protein
MAYVQYTKCVQPDDHVGLAPGMIAIAVGAAIALLAGFVFAALSIGAILALIQYCRWWLYDRLVCLGGDRCAVGLLLATHPPSQKSGFDAFDTDYSIDLLLAPSVPGNSDAVVLGGFQGELIRPAPQITSHGWKTPGERAEAPVLLPVGAPPKTEKMPVLHAEFEGGGVWVLYNFALAALAVVVVGAVLCTIPIIGWIACLIAALIAALLVGIGVVAALNDKGSPTDVNPALDDLHSLEDVLLVRGTWVYDSAHEGWNEIHPIKHCQRIAELSGVLMGWPADIEKRVRDWCNAVDAATSSSTQGLQARPENQWDVHPLVDGCRPVDGEDGAGRPPDVR